MRDNRILVTGASGFIGTFLCSLEPSLFTTTRKKMAGKTDRVIEIDDLNGNTNLQGVFDQIDSIIHLAGLAHSNTFSDEEYNSVNVNGTLHLAREAVKSGVKRFVFVSSISVNGSMTRNIPFSVCSEINPHNAFAKSKYNAEIGLKKIADETGLEVVIIRPTLVYGPNAPGNFGALSRLVSKVPFLPFGLVENKRDFISIQNLADLLLACANHPKASGHTFLASDGHTVSIKDFTNLIAKGVNKKVFQLPIPVWVIKLIGKLFSKTAIVDQLVANLEVDSSNTREVLEWSPPYTMEQAMASLSEIEL
jgi:nucleoside-diphosphate-sugar epimerase